MTPEEMEDKNTTKCYCGHTTFCDCGPLEEPKENNHIVDTNEMVSEDYDKTNSQRFDEFMDLVTSSQIEISDEEIEKASYDQATFAPSFIAGAKWYREQIK